MRVVVIRHESPFPSELLTAAISLCHLYDFMFWSPLSPNAILSLERQNFPNINLMVPFKV